MDLLKHESPRSLLFSTPQDEDDDVKATSFSEAGRSIIDAEDEQRMKSMGDFDSNPNVSAPVSALMDLDRFCPSDILPRF